MTEPIHHVSETLPLGNRICRIAANQEEGAWFAREEGEEGERDRKNKKKTGFVASLFPSDLNAMDGCTNNAIDNTIEAAVLLLLWSNWATRRALCWREQDGT